jgi:Transglycosylase SLT domain
MSPVGTFNCITYRISLALVGPAILVAGFPAGVKMTASTSMSTSISQREPIASPSARVSRPEGTKTSQSARKASTGIADILVSAADFVAPAKRRAAWPLSPRRVARDMLISDFHWSRWQFRYLDMLWEQESGWNPYACNPGSGAYGIPQALPGDKMASAGPDWRTDVRTQVRWGMAYIRDRYGTPLQAWLHEQSDGWY